MALNCYVCYSASSEVDSSDIETLVTATTCRPVVDFLIDSVSIGVNRESPVLLCCECKARLDGIDELIWRANEAKAELLQLFEDAQIKWRDQDSLLNHLDPDDSPQYKSEPDSEAEEKYDPSYNEGDFNGEEIVIKPAKSSRPTKKCSKCSGTCTCAKGRKRKSQTDNSKEVTCSLCEYTFKTSYSLKMHMKHIHFSTEADVLKCDICETKFKYKNNLNKHMLIHTGEYKFQCDECGKQFIHYSSWKGHQRMHADVREKQCEVCNRMFRSSSHLNRHKRVHTGEKPYTCPICEQKFAQRYNMTHHMKSMHEDSAESPKKPILCPICPSSFERQQKLDHHLRIHHHTIQLSDVEVKLAL